MLLPDPLKEWREETERKANPHQSPTPPTHRPNPPVRTTTSHAPTSWTRPGAHLPQSAPLLQNTSHTLSPPLVHMKQPTSFPGNHLQSLLNLRPIGPPPPPPPTHGSTSSWSADVRFAGKFGECIPPLWLLQRERAKEPANVHVASGENCWQGKYFPRRELCILTSLQF